MADDRPLRLCIFAKSMRRHRAYYLPPFARLAETFAELGHEVTILTTAAPDGAEVDRESFADIHYLAETRPGRVDPAFWAASAARFDALHAEQGFDLVMGRGGWHCGYFRHSRFAGEVPAIAHEGTYPLWLHQIETRLPRSGTALAPAFAPFAEATGRQRRQALLRSSRVVCNSPALATALRRVFWWNPPNSVFIPYGFDLTGYVPAEPSVPPRLVFVGRLARDKGLFTLIEMLAGLRSRDVELEAIGPVNDEMRSELQRLAAARGVADRFRMPGPVLNSEVATRLAGATAFVFASTHNEGLPKVVMEAMAAGLPVIAYALPGMDTLVADEVTGFLAAPRDRDRFRDRVEELLSNPAMAAKMGAAGRRRIETEFEPAAILRRWDALFRDVVAEHGEKGSGR